MHPSHCPALLHPSSTHSPLPEMLMVLPDELTVVVEMPGRMPDSLSMSCEKKSEMEYLFSAWILKAEVKVRPEASDPWNAAMMVVEQVLVEQDSPRHVQLLSGAARLTMGLGAGRGWCESFAHGALGRGSDQVPHTGLCLR